MDAPLKSRGGLREKLANTPRVTPESAQETVAEIQATSGILVVPSATTSYVFPYMHLTFAKWERAGGSEKLTMQFATHSVEVCGRHLEGLLTHVRDLMLREIKSLPRKLAEAEGIAGSTQEITGISVKVNDD
jgi:hypothetical protein